MRVRAAAAVAMTAVLAGACGGASGGSAGRGHGLTIEAVAAGTIAARTAHVEGAVSGTNGGEPVKATFSGDADFARNASAVRLAYTGKDTPGKSEIVVFGRDVYFRSESELFGNKYVTFPSDAAFGKSGGDAWIGMGAVGFGVADPVGALRQLRSLATQVRDLGHEEVRGIDTSHKRLTVKVTSLFPCPKDVVDKTDSDTVCGPSAKDSAATIDVWVDDQSRMIRLETRIDLAGSAIASRVDYSRFGEAVDIHRPSKSEILDFDSLAASGSDFGKVVKVTGEWQTVTSGTVGGVHWSLESAPAQDAICLDFVTSPPVAMNPSIVPMGPTVIRGGRDVPCFGSAFSALAQVVSSSAQPGGSVTAVVGIADSSTHSVVAHLADGSSRKVAIDARTRSFVWVGLRINKLVSITAESTQGEITCSDSGTMSALGQATNGEGSPTTMPELPDLGYICLPTADLQKVLLNQTGTSLP